jgi:coenzyme F420 biosynthesis associated uncharacterized protein
MPTLDMTTAMSTARLVLPGLVSDPVAATDLKDRVATEWDDLDAAARDWSGLGADLPPTRGTVVGRLGWIRANLATVTPVVARMSARAPRSPRLAQRVLSTQLGALFGLLSTKVLGQFILPLGEQGQGQLVIVGPNVLDLATEFGPLADDIRRSVVLHEIVHRLQFDATPWLGDHLRDLLDDYVDEAELDPDRLRGVAASLPGVVREVAESGSIQPLLDTVLTAPQRDLLDRAQGLMSLLEGHGNAAMSLAAHTVVADPDGVREALESRRGDLTSRILTAVAGMDLKRQQYAVGEEFVRGVIDVAGIDGLNRAFAEPANLPRVEELDEPAAWVERTGSAGAGPHAGA